jgi:hypothetical protein
MTEGYLYCFSNQSMPGIHKVSMTEQTPDLILNEANTWTISSYRIVIAKKVLNPRQKESELHKLLSQYRVYPGRDFFRISPEEVKTFFELMDGDLWVKDPCRDMTKCFTHGQRIRHTIGFNKTWIGIYDSSKNGIMYDTKFYKSLSGFAETHYSIDRTDRVKSANGWKECKCEVNGKWISTYNL